MGTHEKHFCLKTSVAVTRKSLIDILLGVTLIKNRVHTYCAEYQRLACECEPFSLADIMKPVKCMLIDGHLLTWREPFIYRGFKGVRLIG